MTARALRGLQRHHCGECGGFVADSSVSVYFDIEDNCEHGTGTCPRCGDVDVYLVMVTS